MYGCRGVGGRGAGSRGDKERSLSGGNLRSELRRDKGDKGENNFSIYMPILLSPSSMLLCYYFLIDIYFVCKI
ncbi:MAG: hypothetical protein ACRAVC_16395 [Trichormus sp.]